MTVGNLHARLQYVRPPRSLCVPHRDGQLIGTAGDPDSQRAVLREAFSLLGKVRGPEGWALEDSVRIG